MRVTEMTRRKTSRGHCRRHAAQPPGPGCYYGRDAVNDYRCRACAPSLCTFCKKPIKAGERYRLRFWDDTDVNPDTPVNVAHVDCIDLYGLRFDVVENLDAWALTEIPVARETRKRQAAESLEYVAKHYGLRLEVGQLVHVPGEGGSDAPRVGRVVSGSHYVQVRIRGQRRVYSWHPSDVSPIGTGRKPSVQEVTNG